MSKLVALMAALFLAAHAAAAFRTVTTTTVVTDEGESRPMGQEISMECQMEVRQVDLTPCVLYLGQQALPREGGPRRLQERPSEAKDKCCNQLNNFKRKDCVCPGIQLEMGQVALARPDIVGRMIQEAQNLPGLCNITPSTCKF